MLAKFNIDFGGVNYPLPFKKQNKIYVGFVAAFAGCKRALNGNPCPNCQNPSLWDGLEWDGDIHAWVRDFVRKKYINLSSFNPEINFFYCVLGGEPLDQNERELEIVHNHVMNGCGRNIPTVLFTGYDSWQHSEYVKNFVDFIKLGAYLGNDKRKNNLPSGLATVNQRWERIK
ncbi:MAG: 4Fe-4S cluster-binding domain-containing protein [Synergistaceae bacterium]|nr:4Fe-4S cluster-binding domain-containing protein [Synergistaceae bacterium]